MRARDGDQTRALLSGRSANQTKWPGHVLSGKTKSSGLLPFWMDSVIALRHGRFR